MNNFVPLEKPKFVKPAPGPRAGAQRIKKFQADLRRHEWAMRRFNKRVADGVVGECTVCSINVHAGEPPSPQPVSMPCNLGSCPFEGGDKIIKADMLRDE